MNGEKWVIVIQGSDYYTNALKEAHSLKSDKNFHDAVVYENMSKEEVEEIARKITLGCRCFWWVSSYEEALKDYEKRTYVDPETKKYKWGKYLDIKEALKEIQEGYIVGYTFEGENWFFEDGRLPDLIRTDVIMKATWREVHKVS